MSLRDRLRSAVEHALGVSFVLCILIFVALVAYGPAACTWALVWKAVN